MTAAPELSVVLPTYNERANLEVLIPAIEEAFKSTTFEILVVDDNSLDGTPAAIEAFNQKYGNVRILRRPGLMGIGSALRDGYNAARGELILSSDADQSFDVADMVKLYRKIQEGYDLVIGHRHGEGAVYERKKLIIRIKHFFSSRGNWLVRKLSGVPVSDFSVNFRVIRRTCWTQLSTRENGNAILFEMIVKAARKGFRISEVPATFRERRFGESKLVIWREVPRFFVKFIRYTFFD